MYRPPSIDSGHGAARALRDLPGRVLVATMGPPWGLLQDSFPWEPHYVHWVTDMDAKTLAAAERSLPRCDVVVGVGGGSACDTAKYLAWKRGCPMVLAPTILSVDAPFTNTIAVRVDNGVRYVGDIWPERIILDYDIIQRAPKELNRAGAADIASIHTALFDWRLAHEHTGEPYYPQVVAEAQACLGELDRRASDVHDVTPRGIEAMADLFRREVEFCARIGTSRPEEGSEHIVAYAMEHLTGRHFVHGDLVALGIFLMSRLQGNQADWATDLMERLGLRYACPDASRQEVRECLATVKRFTRNTGLFFSIVDVEEITEGFLTEALAALYGRS